MRLPACCSLILLAAITPLPLAATFLEITCGYKAESLSFFPAYLHEGSAKATAPGPYTLRILDSAGAVLDAIPFDSRKAYACGNGPCRLFEWISLRVNLAREVESRMASVEVLRDGKVLGAILGAPAHQGAEPRAQRLGQGKVRLTWDPGPHPEIRIHNPAGTFLGSATQGALDLETDAAYLDLAMSDGLRSRTRRVQVVKAASPHPEASAKPL